MTDSEGGGSAASSAGSDESGSLGADSYRAPADAPAVENGCGTFLICATTCPFQGTLVRQPPTRRVQLPQCAPQPYAVYKCPSAPNDRVLGARSTPPRPVRSTPRGSARPGAPDKSSTAPENTVQSAPPTGATTSRAALPRCLVNYA